MTVAPIALKDMIAGTRIAATRDAIVVRLGTLLGGVTVVSHPGKLDINDVVAKAVVQAPGVAVGYTRVRELGDPGGTFGIGIDWVAYLVVEDWVDTSASPPRVVGREVVGHAIGLQILRILRDYATASWGLTAIAPPDQDPPPALTPVFTMASQDNMAAIYAVTWTQTLVQEGAPFFNFGPTPGAAPAEGFPNDPDDPAIDFDYPDGPTPPELDHLFPAGGAP